MNNKSEDEYYNQRTKVVKEQLANKESVYLHKYDVKNPISEIIKKYDSISNEERSPDLVQSAGRIVAIRKLGRLNFYKVFDNGNFIQIVVEKNQKEESLGNELENLSINKNSVTFVPSKFSEGLEYFKRGDVIGFTGNPYRTKNSEFSVYATSLTLLTPCLRTLPVEHFGVKDSEIIYRKRYLDLLLNPESKNRFVVRSKTIKYIRKYLDDREFLEVETPMMNLIPGGAAAKPFITHHNELKLDLYMRVSPELYLKQLVIGGLNRVYELGKEYRNEGIDLTHNPEFTSCEFYMAYADYEDLINMTEELLNGMVKSILNEEIVKYWPLKREQRPDPIEINFSRPFKRIDIVSELNLRMKEKMLEWKTDEKSEFLRSQFISDFLLTGENLEKMNDFFVFYLKKENIKINEPLTLTRMLDKLIGEYVEPQCTNPTFVINHPLVMSPLAKKNRNDPFLTERFELFVNGKEICNAYTELNDPFDQKDRFEEQVKDGEKGDDEAMKMDKGFVTALEYGLPPTAGWGIGIDRLVMILTNAANIRDVILFPAMKPEDENENILPENIKKKNEKPKK